MWLSRGYNLIPNNDVNMKVLRNCINSPTNVPSCENAINNNKKGRIKTKDNVCVKLKLEINIKNNIKIVNWKILFAAVNPPKK